MNELYYSPLTVGNLRVVFSGWGNTPLPLSSPLLAGGKGISKQEKSISKLTNALSGFNLFLSLKSCLNSSSKISVKFSGFYLWTSPLSLLCWYLSFLFFHRFSILYFKNRSFLLSERLLAFNR